MAVKKNVFLLCLRQAVSCQVAATFVCQKPDLISPLKLDVGAPVGCYVAKVDVGLQKSDLFCGELLHFKIHPKFFYRPFN